MMHMAAKERKPYTFAKRGVTRTVIIKDAQERTFHAVFNLKFNKVEHNTVEWVYNVLNIKLDASEVFKKLKEIPGNGIYVESMDWQTKFQVSDKNAVEVDDVSGFWRPQATVTSKMGGKTISAPFDPTKREHFNAMLVAFESFVAKNTVLHQKLKPFMDATAVKANNEVGKMMTEARANATNEQLRSAQKRNSRVYENANKILEDIFKEPGGNTTWYTFHGAGLGEEPNTEVSVQKWENERRNSIFLPPFPGTSYTDAASNRQVHINGVMSLLLTFGTNPYPFAVLMTGDFDNVGTLSISKDIRYWAVAKVSGQYVVQEIRIDYKLPEDKLEMACLLAIGAFWKGKA